MANKNPSIPRSVGGTPGDGRVVAITGAANFLGQKIIANLLARDDVKRVIAVDIHTVQIDHPKFSFYKVDLSLPNTGALLAKIFTKEEVDSLMHLIFVFSLARRSTLAHELEAIGTMHLLDGCAAAGVRKIVLRSSSLVYGAQPQNHLFMTEETPLAPAMKSFVSDKIEAERQIKQFAERHGGVQAVVIREGTTVGPTARNYFLQLFLRRRVPMLMGFDPLMQFIHEDDLLKFYLSALFTPVEGVYNIVAPGVVRYSEVIDMFRRVPLTIPEPMLQVALNVLWSLQLHPIAPDLLPYLKYPLIVDGSKAEYAFGVLPRYSSRDAVEAAARNLRPSNDETR